MTKNYAKLPKFLQRVVLRTLEECCCCFEKTPFIFGNISQFLKKQYANLPCQTLTLGGKFLDVDGLIKSLLISGLHLDRVGSNLSSLKPQSEDAKC